MLYSFGSNGNGQLSLSHTTDTPTPTRCTSTTPLPAAPPVIVPGGNHTLLLFPSTGTAFAAGANPPRPVLPPPSTTTPPQLTSFRRVPPPPAPDTTHYTLASAGWSFTVLATAANTVYVSGHGGKGELGLGAATATALLQRIPAFPPPGARVAALASGMAHTLAVMDDGAVYGWGAGRHGQLGAPAAAVVGAPRRVGGVGWPVEMAACGREFSVFVSRAEAGGARRVAVLGRGGERYGLREGLVGGLMAGGSGVVGVQAGWGGVVVRFAGGAVRGWGRGDRGQLPPEEGLEVEALAVGSEHGVAVVAGGGVVAWGWGEHGNCGAGGDVPVGTVRAVPVPGARGRAVAVGAGCATSWVWVEEEGEGEAGEAGGAGEGVGGAA